VAEGVSRRLLVFVTVLCALTTACGGAAEPAGPSPSGSARDCRGLTFPYPTADVTLGAKDAGRSVTVAVGGLVEVDLIGSPARRWSSIVLTGTGLISLGTQAETPTVGTQLGEYCAVSPGSSQLGSSDQATAWAVSVDVH
jgi:hypothetical protein